MKFVAPEIEAYCAEHTVPRSAALEGLAEATLAEMEAAMMMVGKIEGNLLRLLVHLVKAEQILEIGTFTGYSALAMAEALPAHGKLITCDISAESTALAQKYWAQSEHGKKIELRLGPALDTVASLEGPLDLVFIDADKTNYLNYWEACLPKLRSGGLMVVDNVLWSGRVLNPESEADHAIAQLNAHARQDSRVECAMLSVRDGMLLAWKKPS